MRKRETWTVLVFFGYEVFESHALLLDCVILVLEMAFLEMVFPLNRNLLFLLSFHCVHDDDDTHTEPKWMSRVHLLSLVFFVWKLKQQKEFRLTFWFPLWWWEILFFLPFLLYLPCLESSRFLFVCLFDCTCVVVGEDLPFCYDWSCCLVMYGYNCLMSMRPSPIFCSHEGKDDFNSLPMIMRCCCSRFRTIKISFLLHFQLHLFGSVIPFGDYLTFPSLPT
jgi:hypothetical protein